MNPNVEISIFEVVVEALGTVFGPGIEGMQAQRDLRIRSIDGIPLAVTRAGYEISYVDLPVNVSGFAQVIDDERHIAVNREKPLSHRVVTIAHELGHHRLHLNSSGSAGLASPLSNSATEFEANMFAAMFVAPLTSGRQQEELLAQNPEIRSTLIVPVIATLMAILVALVIWIWSYLDRRLGPKLLATT
jgi:hypothetical protein